MLDATRNALALIGAATLASFVLAAVLMCLAYLRMPKHLPNQDEMQEGR